MSKKKTTQQQTQTNSYGYMTPPSTADTDAYRNQINNSYNTPDPSIASSFAGQRQHLMDRFTDNPFGANYSPEVQDAYKYAGQNDLDQQQGQAYREDAYNRNAAKTGALAGLAGMTAPQLVQTGGTMNGTTTQSGGLFQSIMGAAAGVGQAALL